MTSCSCSWGLSGGRSRTCSPPISGPDANQRLFAGWLHEHPSDCDAYARLKRDLYDDRE